jgi:hypothetical protein
VIHTLSCLLLEAASYARLRAGTLADLLDRWFKTASPGWALTTVSHTRSFALF